METRAKHDPRKDEKTDRRDWDKSEWFRRWLELIRQNPRQRGAN
jgi:hypothetical protein